MGIDPVSHKPKNDTLLSNDGQSKSVANLSHMTQWESARLEAEAKLVKQSKLQCTSPAEKQVGLIKSSPTSINLLVSESRAPTRCLDILKAWNRVCSKKHNDKSENQTEKSDPGFNRIHMPDDSKNEQLPGGNFLESFTDLLLSSSGTGNNHCNLQGASGESSTSVGHDGASNSYYEDNNKNYWNNILDLVNSSLQEPPMF